MLDERQTLPVEAKKIVVYTTLVQHNKQLSNFYRRFNFFGDSNMIHTPSACLADRCLGIF